MSRNRRSARLISSKPRTAATPKRQTAGGDNPYNLDEELQTVLQKEYDEGEPGKNEAIRDVKTVLKEVSSEPVAEAMERLMPRFLTPKSPAGTEVPCTSRGNRSKQHTPRHAKLTARPLGRQMDRVTTEESQSVPHIPKSSENDTMRLTTSVPTLPGTVCKTSSYPSYTDTDTPSDINEASDGVGVFQDISNSSLQADRTPTPVHYLYASDFMTGAEGTEEDEELPYTENLLEMPSDTEETEEIWKSDIVELTKMKSAPKGKLCGTDILELKYKEPMWPHQLLLNQTLARLPKLTHLVLDGSELRFLRDLGSSLQSLITLSICDCGLRSLDGAYAFPNLRTLIARKNMIRIPTQCSFLTRLSYLDLSSNPISTFDEFTNLRHCGELRILKLHDTPLAIQPNFNKEMKRVVPQLKEIHPPSSFQLKQIRKQGQQQMREESKQVENKESSSMPSMSYDHVMADEPKPGLAYQKIRTKQANLNEQSEIEDVSLGTGDYSGVFMAPKFLQHLEKVMPPPTAEESPDTSVASTPANHHENEIHQQQKSHKLPSNRIPKKKI